MTPKFNLRDRVTFQVIADGPGDHCIQAVEHRGEVQCIAITGEDKFPIRYSIKLDGGDVRAGVPESALRLEESAAARAVAEFGKVAGEAMRKVAEPETPTFRRGDRVKIRDGVVHAGETGTVTDARPGGTVSVRVGTSGCRHGYSAAHLEPEPAAPKWATSQTADLAERDADEVLCLYFRDGQFYGAASRDIDSCSAIITHQGPVPAVAVAARRIVQFAIQDDDED